MIGEEIGSYCLVARLGAGGMGEVYVGEHTLLGRKAAVKVLLEEWNSDERIVARFINEARASSQIVHPGVVRIYDFGKTPGGKAYMLMELLDGESLENRLARGPLTVAESVGFMRQLADALAVAHGQRVVHRDLKPENVFLVLDATVPLGVRTKILDFGIAKMLDPTENTPKTQTGSILGTPTYMSPEQCKGEKTIDHRADLYSLGCVFFHMLCGRPPFDYEGIGQLLGAHLYSPPPSPTSVTPTLPPALDEIMARLLAKKPDERYASTAELIVAIDQLGLGPAPMRTANAALSTAERRVMASTPDAAGATQVAAAPTVMVPTAAPAATPAPARKPEVTTLGGSTGQVEPSLIPQPETPRSGSMTIMAVAFGATVCAALGGFFLFGRHAPPAVNANVGATPLPATATFDIDSEPTGADVLVDGARIGATPYVGVEAAAPGSRQFTLRRAGYEDLVVTIPADRGGQQRVTLKPKPTP